MRKFVVSAALLYLLLQPVWRAVTVPYGYLLARAYVLTASVWEHPRRSAYVRLEADRTRIYAADGRTGLEIQSKNLFIDLPILIALVLSCWHIGWMARLRMVVLGYLPLGAVHFVGLVCSLHLAHAAQNARVARTDPSWWTLEVVAPLRRLVYSDWVLLLPFVVWGLLYARECRLASRQTRRSAKRPCS